MRLLTDEFIGKYEGLEAMKPLGSFVYYRTYSRWLPEKGRRETWVETARRAVEYNCSLDKNCTREEAEELFDNVVNLRCFLSGRTFWIGGTEAVSDHPLANFNCSGIVLNKYEKLQELFYALMVGTGAGFRVLQEEDISHLPQLRKVTLKHKKYKPKARDKRAESTSLIFKEQGAKAVIHVGDSKEGWTQALGFYFDLLTKKEYRKVVQITMDYDSVRPKGERLKRFGGTASGHNSLLNMFIKINKVIQSRFTDGVEIAPVESIDMLDFANIIAENVVVGGVRRSAEIGMIGADDTKCIQAKNGLYTQDKDGNWVVDTDIIHRQLSNNTIIHWKKPTREFWHWQFEQMRFSGEPAFYNGANALSRNKNFKLTNPCGEVLLDDQQTCNLVTINVMAFVKDGRVDLEALLRTQELNARASYRMTLVELELPEWNYKLHRDRLLGVSLTGWQDMVNAVNMDKNAQKYLLDLMRDRARKGADDIAEELGLNKSLLVTTVKPEGTLSLLPTVSSGLHFSHSAYYVRRIRINADDALAKVCLSLGYPVHPEVGQTWENARTYVIEFPVKAPEGRTKYDVSAIEQLEIYKMFMDFYVGHNASITVSVREHEWEAVEEWVYENWDSCIGISFLALDDSYFQLLPFEAITEEEYNNRVAEMKDFNPELLLQFEKGEEFDIGDSECTGGACPIR
ncbi:MAG: ribonucleoside-triphosphate reductase, adenosylcobalamin-dependent [Clostridium sp.]|uniref:ribonucleoside-triphosphate reductase, adenosylcobalamin-dependent n=1 Tax=Clostridium sp. TaxID=1506 RepID=UPI0039EB22E1